MTTPAISIHLNEPEKHYQPGDILTGYYRNEQVRPDELQSVEVSVLWYTEGKGDLDLGVHQFKRYSVGEGDYIDPRHPGRFSTQLPNSPLSYDGAIFKIHWTARVRLFLVDRQEFVRDHYFRLGRIPPAGLLKTHVELQHVGGY